MLEIPRRTNEFYNFGDNSSRPIDRIREWLSAMPLASANDLLQLGEFGATTINGVLRDLEGTAEATHVRLGQTRGITNRYLLTSIGVRRVYPRPFDEIPWSNTERGIKTLIQRLPMVENLYAMATSLLDTEAARPFPAVEPPMANPTFFLWLRSSNVHAVVNYGNDVWVPMIWAGPWASYPTLARKWEYQLHGLNYRSPYGPPTVWDVPDEQIEETVLTPSGWAVAAADLWSAQNAAHVVQGIWPTAKRILTVNDRRRFGSGQLVPTEYQLFAADNDFSLAIGFPERVAEWAINDPVTVALNGKLNTRVAMTVEEWPGIRVGQISAMLKESNSTILPILNQLIAAGIVCRFEYRYFLGPVGMLWTARRDRISVRRVQARMAHYLSANGWTRQLYQDHDEKVINLAIAFKRCGVPVACGWRATLDVQTTQLAPDAVVRIGSGPFGPGWYYLEYEQSANTPTKILRKLRNYIALAEQGYRIPLLVVCASEAAQRAFQDIGQGADLDLLTALYDDAIRGPITGNDNVWQYYGKKIALDGPTDEQLADWPAVRSSHMI